MVNKLASAIYNDIVGGLAGITSTPNLSLLQLEDDCVDERLQIIKEYSMKNLIPKKDLVMSINCITVDCKSLDKCPCGTDISSPELHFEIPQIVNDLGSESIEYIGSINKKVVFKVYTNITAFRYHQFLRHGSHKPFVYIDTTPNNNNKYDGWIFNSPLLEKLSLIAIFKDPRQLEEYDCCAGDDLENYTFLSAEIKKRLTEKKIRYYRQLAAQPQPNNQVPK
jgi:hypothetical protein